MSASKSYSEKLRDPRWQKRRLEIMQRDEFKCADCQDTESTLNVHHRYYVARREPWCYPAGALVTLCEDCHRTRSENTDGLELWECLNNAAMLADEELAWQLGDALLTQHFACAVPMKEVFRAVLLMLNNPNYIESAYTLLQCQTESSEKESSPASV